VTASPRRVTGAGRCAERAAGGAGSADDRPTPVDIRLLLGAGIAWLGVLFALRGSAGSALAMVAVALVGGSTALLVARRWAPAAGVAAPVALAAFCLALVVAPLAVRLSHARDSPLARLARQRSVVTARLTVADDPRPLRANGPDGAPRVAVDVRVDEVTLAGRVVPGSGSALVLAPATGWTEVLPGQRVALTATLQPPLGGDLLTAVLLARGEPEPLGAPPWWQRAAGVVRSSLRLAAAGLPEGPRGLLPGLVDGDTSGLDPVLAQRFRVAGLTHLVAVSGTNCSIVTGVVLLGLRRIRAGPRTCAGAGIAVLIAFVIVARPSPSVLRAALMTGIALVALGLGRARAGPPLLAAAVLVVLLWRPQLAADAGFAMSALATGALLMVAPGWAAALQRHRVPPFLAESLAVATAAHLVSAPVIAAFSGQLSVVAIPANMLAEPVVAPATIFGFGAALVAPFALPVARVLAQLAGWPCRWLVGVADHFGGLPGAMLPWPGGLVGGAALLGITVALAVLVWRGGVGRALAVAALAAVALQIPLREVAADWPPAGWVFVACDVGQGDALALAAGPGAAVVVDAGPEPVGVDRCLADLGVTEVPLLVLTHYHLDHVGGIVGVLHGRRVSAVLGSPLAEPASGVTVVRDALAGRGLGVDVAPVGTRLAVGGVRLTILGPAAPFHGTRSDPNNSSLVLLAEVGGARVMLAADAEIEAQRAVLARGGDLRADVLKVPHHGSAYFDPAFPAAVGPRVAVVSVGAGNSFGQPAPSALREYAVAGVPLWRTDLDGDVAITARHGALSAVGRSGAPALASAAGGHWAHGPRACATMAGCPPVPGPLNPRLTRSPTATSLSRSCPPSRCCSVTRSCWWRGRSARSPPGPAPLTRAPTSASGSAATSTRPSWRSCSVRRYSAGGACW